MLGSRVHTREFKLEVMRQLTSGEKRPAHPPRVRRHHPVPTLPSTEAPALVLPRRLGYASVHPGRSFSLGLARSLANRLPDEQRRLLEDLAMLTTKATARRSGCRAATPGTDRKRRWDGCSKCALSSATTCSEHPFGRAGLRVRQRLGIRLAAHLYESRSLTQDATPSKTQNCAASPSGTTEVSRKPAPAKSTPYSSSVRWSPPTLTSISRSTWSTGRAW